MNSQTTRSSLARKPGSENGAPPPAFGQGRVCSIVGCETRLSSYNPSSICALHAGGWDKAPSALSTRSKPKCEPIQRVCANPACNKAFSTRYKSKVYCTDFCRIQATNTKHKFRRRNENTVPLNSDRSGRYFPQQTPTVLAFFLENPTDYFLGVNIVSATKLHYKTIHRVLESLEAEGWVTGKNTMGKFNLPVTHYKLTPEGQRQAKSVLEQRAEKERLR